MERWRTRVEEVEAAGASKNGRCRAGRVALGGEGGRRDSRAEVGSTASQGLGRSIGGGEKESVGVEEGDVGAERRKRGGGEMRADVGGDLALAASVPATTVEFDSPQCVVASLPRPVPEPLFFPSSHRPRLRSPLHSRSRPTREILLNPAS